MKSKVFNYFLAWLVIIIFNSCEEMVVIDLTEGFTPEYAVSSLVCVDSSVSINLSSTSPAYANKTNFPDVDNVSIFEGGFEYVFYKDHENIGKWACDELIPREEAIYHLKVYSGRDVLMEALDSMPSKGTIVNTSVHPIGKKNQINTRLVPPSSKGKTTYFELVVFVQYFDEFFFGERREEVQTSLGSTNPIITNEDYYPGLLLFGAGYPKSLLFGLNENIDTLDIQCFYEPDMVFNLYGDLGGSVPEHTVRVELRTVSYSYYLYKTTLYTQQYAVQGDILYGIASPVDVFSNIVNGRGIFAGYAKDYQNIHVADRVLEN